MSNYTTLVTMLEEFTGISGSNYSVRQSRAINWAQRAINSVRWDFLFAEGTGFNTAQSDKQYTLKSDFLLPYKFYLNNGTSTNELIQGIFDDIVTNPPSSEGVPKYFCLGGTDTYPTVYIGCPTADAAYAVTYGYYKKLSTLSGTGESDISIIWGDDPIILGAAYKFWQYVELPQKADLVFPQFWQAMKEMEENVPFIGKSWTETHPLPQG